jgi:hypothetical protein
MIKLFKRHNSQTLKDYLETNFSFGSTSWYKYIKQVRVTVTKVIIQTNILPKDSVNVRGIGNAVLGWTNNNSNEKKIRIRKVIIQDINGNVLYKVKNPLAKI